MAWPKPSTPRRRQLGTLGTHSKGKIEAGDKGDLALSIAVDHANKLIRIDFGTEITWIGMHLPEARQMRDALSNAILALEHGD